MCFFIIILDVPSKNVPILAVFRCPLIPLIVVFELPRVTMKSLGTLVIEADA